MKFLKFEDLQILKLKSFRVHQTFHRQNSTRVQVKLLNKFITFFRIQKSGGHESLCRRVCADENFRVWRNGKSFRNLQFSPDKLFRGLRFFREKVCQDEKILNLETSPNIFIFALCTFVFVRSWSLVGIKFVADVKVFDRRKFAGEKFISSWSRKSFNRGDFCRRKLFLRVQFFSGQSQKNSSKLQSENFTPYKLSRLFTNFFAVVDIESSEKKTSPVKLSPVIKVETESLKTFASEQFDIFRQGWSFRFQLPKTCHTRTYKVGKFGIDRRESRKVY